MRANPPERLYGAQTHRVDTTHGPAHGAVIGMLIGLGFWFAVILLAVVISSL